MTQSHVSSTALRPQAAARRSGWTGGRIAALVIGALLVLLSLALLGGGGTGLWADRTQRDAGYVTTDVHKFSTFGAALATESTHLGSPGVGWLYSPGLLGKVRIRVTPVDPGSVLFVGIGPSADVDRYLAGVKRTVISEFFEDKAQAVDGGPVQSPPETKDFWVASATGPGAQTLKWDPANGSWTVVVMNADGRPAIDVSTDLGARMTAVLWIAVGLLAAGAIFLAGGALLIAGAIRGRRASQARTVCVRERERRRSHARRQGSCICVPGQQASGGHRGVPDAQDAREQHRVQAAARAWL